MLNSFLLLSDDKIITWYKMLLMTSCFGRRFLHRRAAPLLLILLVILRLFLSHIARYAPSCISMPNLQFETASAFCSGLNYGQSRTLQAGFYCVQEIVCRPLPRIFSWRGWVIIVLWFSEFVYYH